MLEIVNILSKALSAQSAVPSKSVAAARSSNPFVSYSGNPFVTAQGSSPFASYGQNKPVAGGYFAGYYNNRPNIVGRRLFIEV